MAENENKKPTTEPQQDVAKSSDAKAEAAATAKASDELSEGDLEAVAGGRGGIQEPRASSEMAGGSVW